MNVNAFFSMSQVRRRPLQLTYRSIGVEQGSGGGGEGQFNEGHAVMNWNQSSVQIQDRALLHHFIDSFAKPIDPLLYKACFAFAFLCSPLHRAQGAFLKVYLKQLQL